MQRVAALPLVRTTCTAVSDAYSAAKDRHPLLGSACRLAEHCVCGLTTRALDHAQPLLSHLQPQCESPWPVSSVLWFVPLPHLLALYLCDLCCRGSPESMSLLSHTCPVCF